MATKTIKKQPWKPPKDHPWKRNMMPPKRSDGGFIGLNPQVKKYWRDAK